MKSLPLAGAFALLVVAGHAAAQDTRAIQVREAQRTDERTFAYFGQFRAALAARFGADPLLSKLVFSEQEGQALVHRTPDAPAEHVIYQTGTWISTDGRQLKAWAPGADPAVARFRLSAVSEAMLREKFRAYRAQSAKAADHLGEVTVGYFGTPFNRLMAEVTVGSMTTFGMSVWAFDLKGGQPQDVNAAIADVRAQRPAPAVAVGKAGTAIGSLNVGGVALPLGFSYTFVAPDPLDALQKRPMLLLTEQAIAPSALAQAPDLDRVLGALPHYVLVIRSEAALPKVAMIVWHPKLGAAPAVEKDAGKSGVAKFDAYGAQRIAGSLASPGGGKAAYAWNEAIRLDVKFDAPISRGW